jgi:uncharacterized protein YpbB
MSLVTITGEANSQVKSPLDISRKSNKYVTSNGIYVFPSPSLYTLEKNLFYLLHNSIEKLFEKKYIMKPSYLSYDEYGTTFLGETLMYVNGISCLEEFDMEYVVVPSLESLIKINIDNKSSYDSYDKIKQVDI